jgi:methionyl-tRNA synthetase
MTRFTVGTSLEEGSGAQARLGAVFAALVGDAIARWHRLRGDEAQAYLGGAAAEAPAAEPSSTEPLDPSVCDLWLRSGSAPAAQLAPSARQLALGALAYDGDDASIEPRRLVDALGEDALRWYLLRELSPGQGGSFSHRKLLARHDAELADAIGNLLGRALGLRAKLRGGAPTLDGEAGSTPLEAKLEEAARVALAGVASAFEEAAPHRATDSIWTLAKAANRYVDEAAPWAEAKKGDAGRARVDGILVACLETLRWLSVLLWPVVPSASARMRAQLGLPAIEAPLGRAGSDQTALAFARRWEVPAPVASATEPLFPKLDDARREELLASLGVAAKPASEAAEPKKRGHEKKPIPEPAAEIGFDELTRLDLRIGTVLAAARVPKSEKLLKLEVDLGEPPPRLIVAGIGKSYAPEALIGQHVTVVANLKPATLMGLESRGMVLAVGGGGGDADLALLQPSRARKPGTRVT